ncbi:MAG: type II secretion system inner membrane protein GspF [Porticoccaceae bacterium]
MSVFDYAAVDQQGKQHRGVMEGDSPRQVRQQLRERGLVPLQVGAAAEKTVGGERRQWFGGRLGSRELALITRQIAALVQAGMPLAEVLAAVAAQLETRRGRRVVTAVRAKVREGYSFADGLAEFPDSFDRLYRATVLAGEQSGHLDLVLAQLADYTDSSREFRQRVQLALIYPVLLLTLSLVIVTGLMVYVVPDVIKVFVGTGQPLPPLTLALVAASDFVAAWGWLVALVIIGAGVALRLALRRPGFRKRVHRGYLHWPLLRRLSRGTNTARYANTLSILTASGVPLVDAMQIAVDVIGNDYLRERVVEAKRRVSEGDSLSRALAEAGYFPPLMVHMIASGEASGQLDEMLVRTARQQQRELETTVATLVALCEPLMLLAMGAVVLLIVLAILLPILNLNQLVS